MTTTTAPPGNASILDDVFRMLNAGRLVRALADANAQVELSTLRESGRILNQFAYLGEQIEAHALAVIEVADDAGLQ